MAMLVEYHKQLESSWLPDETRQEAAEIYCKTAYSSLTDEELQSEIARILESEAESAMWQEQIQAGVYGRELISQPEYLAYAFREFVKNEGMGRMHDVLLHAGMGTKMSQPRVDPVTNEEFKRAEPETRKKPTEEEKVIDVTQNAAVSVHHTTVIESASAPKKGGETIVGHALQKHAGRNPQIWGRVKGGSEEINQTALKHLTEILHAPGQFERVTNPRGTTFLEKKLPDGRGVRLNLDGTFKGFIDQ